MINVRKIKSLKGLSANYLPKIKRITVCPDRKDYMSGAPTFLRSLNKAFGYRQNIVYVLWVNSEIVYIGKSKYIQQRLSAHKTRIDYTHASLINLTDEQTMNDVEIRLIQKHRPVFNKRHNPDRGYPVIN